LISSCWPSLITAILRSLVRLPDPLMVLCKYLLIPSYLFPIVRVYLTCVQYPVSITPHYERVIINSLLASSLILVCVYLPSFLILPLGNVWVFYHF
jgi:hypothetical protein